MTITPETTYTPTRPGAADGNGHGTAQDVAAATDASDRVAAGLAGAAHGADDAAQGAGLPRRGGDSRGPRIGAKTIIRARDINKRYVMGKDNYVDALLDASLEIAEGQTVAIMGPSGSGKSTLLHVLGCLDSATSGEVWLDGRRVDNLGGRDLARLRRNEVGFIFQTFNLVPSLSALENVMLAAEYAGKSRRDAREAARAALAQVGLSDRESHRPPELSGGQQQRVAIARALVNKPKVIFGDEPTGNLDSVSSAEVVQMMQRINRETGTTFVLVTHDPGVAASCDRVFHMLDGRVTNGCHGADDTAGARDGGGDTAGAEASAATRGAATKRPVDAAPGGNGAHGC